MVWPIDDVVSLAAKFLDVALVDPLSALLLTVGAAVTGATVAVGAALVGGAVLDATG